MFPLDRMPARFVRTGQLTVIDAAGTRHVFAGRGDTGVGGVRVRPVTIRLHDRRLSWQSALNPELHTGEASMDGRVTMEWGSTIRDFLTLVSASRYSLGKLPVQRAAHAVNFALRTWQQSNRPGEARRNVARHHDIGNDFYRLVLDRNMPYSCAYFRDPAESPPGGAAQRSAPSCGQAGAAPGPARSRHRLRLGRPCTLPRAARGRAGDRRDAVAGT